MDNYVPKGIKQALKILHKEMSKGDMSNFLVYYDPDIDGLLAGYMAQRFLRKFGKTSQYHINENRTHGFRIPEKDYVYLKGMTIIAVDFSMTREEIKKIIAAGMNIISIDHHNIDDTFVYEQDFDTGCEGVIINNQYTDEPEEYRFLSGAGVVHYVFKNVLKELGLPHDDKEEIALVGITLLSDVRPTEGKIAQEFLKETYSNESPFLKYLVRITTQESRFESFGVPRMNRNFIDYTFSPHLNALFRLNKGHDAIKLISGDRGAIYSFKDMCMLTACKNLQNHITEQIISALDGAEYSSLIVKGVSNTFKIDSNYQLSNFIGLACSRIRGDYKTTFLYVEGEEDGIIQRGSVRGLYDTVDYLGIFRSFGIKAEGHKNAFGVLETDIRQIDIEGLNIAISSAEEEAKANGTDNRKIIETNNLSLFLKGPNKQIAWLNTMVRDSYRVYLKYTGDDIQAQQRGKMIEYTIDGIPVKCFDLDLKVEDALILPIYGKGDYIEFTLKRAPN